MTTHWQDDPADSPGFDDESAWDDVDDADAEDDLESSVVPCPSCGADVYEEADSCPHCGEFLTGSALRRDRWSGWRGCLLVLVIGWLVVVLSNVVALLLPIGGAR